MMYWITFQIGPCVNWTALHLGTSRVTGLNYYLRRGVCRWNFDFVATSCTYFG